MSQPRQERLAAFVAWARAHVTGDEKGQARPQYAVLSNFDEFWIYDFNVQMDSTVDTVKLEELPTRYGPLAFLFPTNEKPVFGNDQEAVTRKAADLLGMCFNKLIVRRVPRYAAQSFTLQMLVALFAEDIGLLEKYFVTRLLEECKTPADAFDKLGGLFEAMNTSGGVRGGRYKGVDDAHAALDAAVLAAYGFSAKKDLLAQLLELNLAVAAAIDAGVAVTAPGIPPGYPHRQSLITSDCIRPAV